MIDMAQADSSLRRTSARPLEKTWGSIASAPVGVARGDLCVVRSSSGVPEILKIDPQCSYREWVGCFTYVGDLV